jgi:hypothetical protein
MDKILEALTKMLPEDQVSDVAEAVKAELESAKSSMKDEMEKEYSSKLEEAYEELSQELKSSENTAVQGYQEAYAIIADLRKRLETQQAEFDSAMHEGYEEAFQMLQAEKGKNENIEVEMYDEFNKKLHEMKEYMVDKLDAFLQYKGQEIYEQARKDIMADPRYAEHKVALDRVVETVSDYITDTDYAAVTSTKLDEADGRISDLEGQLRILEARNIRLNTENGKLNEAVREAQQVITESAQSDEQERQETAKNVTGRGRAVSDPELIAEWKNPVAEGKRQETENADTTLVESLDPDFLHQMQVLAGTKNED